MVAISLAGEMDRIPDIEFECFLWYEPRSIHRSSVNQILRIFIWQLGRAEVFIMYFLGHFFQILHMSAEANQKKKKQFYMDTTIVSKPQLRYIETCAVFLFPHYNFCL